jgi:hypothetical protein
MFPILFTLVIWAGCLGAEDSLAENLVVNGGFEAGKSGWGQFIPEESKSASVSWNISETDPHGGTVAAVMTNPKEARWALNPAARIPVKPGEKYRVTAWIRFGKDAKLEGTFPAAYVRLVFTDAGQKDISDRRLHIHLGLSGNFAWSTALAMLNVASLPTNWKKMEGVLEIPPGADLVGINLMVHGVSGTIYWDDIAFEPVPAVTPLSPALDK